MPMNRALYPPTWEAISLRIRFERAAGRCEWCGLAHGAVGYRAPDGRFWTDDELDRLDGGDPFDGQEPKPLTIILTVAHLGTPLVPGGPPTSKHDKMDVREENLAALCQRCHLNYDRDDHMANAAATRDRKRHAALQAAGQMAMELETI